MYYQCRLVDGLGWNRVQFIPTATLGSIVRLPVGKLGPRDYTITKIYLPGLPKSVFEE